MSQRLATFACAAALLTATRGLPAQSGDPSRDPYAGHAVVSGPVRLMAIEPFSSTTSGEDELPGRAVQVQYPLDNEAYEGPPAPAPSGYPMYAPGVTGISPLADHTQWVDVGQVGWETTWVASLGDADAFGIFTNELRIKLESPAAKMLTATPRFAWHLLDGPVLTDLPGQLYDASVETVLSLPLRDTLFMQAAISPSIFTDGQNTSTDALRFPARLLFFWTCTEKLTLSGGVVYLDREDVSFLPSAGLIYKPSDTVRFDLLIPRPRVAWRYSTEGTRERWLYVVGEFGGGSWAIERANGVDDVATLSDYRLLAGWEQKDPEGPGFRLETGFVFNRSLEYLSDVGNIDPPGTALVRFAMTY